MARRNDDGLVPEAVFRAALAIVDDEGIAALSMRRLATELGVGVATLYGSVRSRDAILDGIARLLIAETDVTIVPGEQWADAIRRNGRAYRRIAQRHPRAFGLLALRQSDDPEGLAHVARVIAMFRSVGFSAQQSLVVNGITDAYESGFCLIEAQMLADGRLPVDPDGDGALLTPVLQQRLLELVSDAGFERGLDLIIAGIAATMPPDGPV